MLSWYSSTRRREQHTPTAARDDGPALGRSGVRTGNVWAGHAGPRTALRSPATLSGAASTVHTGSNHNISFNIWIFDGLLLEFK